MLKIGLSILALAILFAVAPLSTNLNKVIPFQQATITLDPTTSYQTMVGWEAVAQAGQISEVGTVSNRSNVNPAFLNYKNQLYDFAVNDLGLNRIRLELRSGLENSVDYWERYTNGQISYNELKVHRYEIINDNNDPQVINPDGFKFFELDFNIENVVIPFRQRLAARGEKLYLNLNYVDFADTAFGASQRAGRIRRVHPGDVPAHARQIRLHAGCCRNRSGTGQYPLARNSYRQLYGCRRKSVAREWIQP